MNTTALPVATQPLQAGVAAVPHLGVIRARGADAASFLHGQLTQDFLLMKPTEARLAAFCSAKGRMQASFVGRETHGARRRNRDSADRQP